LEKVNSLRKRCKETLVETLKIENLLQGIAIACKNEDLLTFID
jgi:hypothetical protein